MAAIAERLQVRRIEILLVEDNPGDVRLIQEGLRESNIVNRMHTVSDGHEALAFLRKQGRFAQAIRPDLILLDLNLPRKDGREVLSEIKADADLRRIPVVIVTSSRAEEDVLTSYDHYANCYITKPLHLEKFLEVIKAIQDFWVGIVSLPPQ